jgi:hypothetical protein
MTHAGRLIGLAAAVPAVTLAAGGCVVQTEKQPPGYLGPVEYHDLGRVATETPSEGVHKLNFAGHAMVFEKSRIELDETDLWARSYQNVVLRRGPGGELLMTVDGQRVPTHVRLN